MKKFDFNHAEFKKHHKDIQDFLMGAYKSGMSKESFVSTYKVLPRPLKADGKSKSKKSRRSPSYLGKSYDKLKNDFNFF